MECNESFEYTYSAPEQEEVRRIREKYLPRQESKLEQLRRLDAGVTNKGTVLSLIVGILSCLVMGGGMSLCMVGPGEYIIAGIVIGVIGMLGAASAYPIYSRVTAKERERIAPEILRLTEELEKGQ